MTAVTQPWLARGTLLGVCALLLLAGLAFILSPVIFLAVAAGAAFLFVSWNRPVAALGCFAVIQIAFPIYAKLPGIGPIPPVPVAAAALATIFGTTVLAWLAGARMPALASGGRLFMGAFFVFAAIALLSLLDERTTSEGMGMWVKVFVLPGTLMWLFLFHLRGAADVDHIVRYLMVGGSAAAIYALIESVIGYNPLLDIYSGQIDVTYFTSAELGSALAYRAFSVFTQPIEYATCLAMIFPFALIRFVGSTNWKNRLFNAVAAGLCAIGVALTFSRGPILALLTALIIIGVIYRSLRPWLAGFLIVGLLTVLAAWPFLGAGISDRLGDVDNVTLRFKLWQTAWAIFSEHPILGIGIGNFPEYYLDAARNHLIGPFYEFGAESVENIRVAENTYLQLIAEMGLLGLAGALAVIAAFLRMVLVVVTHSREPLSRDLAVASGIAALVYFISGITITAYTHFVSTIILIGMLFTFAAVLERSLRREKNATGAIPLADPTKNIQRS